MIGEADRYLDKRLAEEIMRSGISHFHFRFNVDSENMESRMDDKEDFANAIDEMMEECTLKDSLPRMFLKMLANCEFATNYVVSNDTIISEDGRVLVQFSKIAKSYKIPQGVEIIGHYAFSKYDCESVEICNSVYRLGKYCFYDCEDLKEIELPDSINQLGMSCFEGCSSLVSAVMSSNVTEIPDSCFSFDYSLKNLPLTPSVKYIRYRAFYGCIFPTVNIPEGVEVIEAYSFYCELEVISLPSTMKELDSEFYLCDYWEAIYDENYDEEIRPMIRRPARYRNV